MFEKSVKPLEPYAPTILRLMVGITFLLHGWAKLQNPGGFIGFVGSLGFPASVLFGWFVILLEFVGGLFLILGVGVRPIGLLLTIEMLITSLVVKSNVGFIGQEGAGAELDLMLLATSLSLFILGPGALSILDLLPGRSEAMGRRAI